MISLLRDRSRGRGASSFWKVADASFEPDSQRISSLSIAGYDPETGEVGIAMASRFFAVAPIAVHVRADVGAVATMGGSPYKDANEMLDWLEEGETPEGVIERLRDRYGDEWGGGQINIVDVKGRSISATGTESMWKGQRFGKNYATSGNILAGPGSGGRFRGHVRANGRLRHAARRASTPSRGRRRPRRRRRARTHGSDARGQKEAARRPRPAKHRRLRQLTDR